MKPNRALMQAWQALWILKKQRAEPVWASVAVCAMLGSGMWLLLLALGAAGLVSIESANPAVRQAIVPGSLLLCLFVTLGPWLLARLAERLLPEQVLATLSPACHWRAGLAMNALVIVGAMAGYAAALSVSSLLFQVDLWARMASIPSALFRFLLLVLAVLLLNGVFWRLRLERQALRLDTAEATLRLLQGQIEPHFLFNTLANIHILMEEEPLRARHMLEQFSDYLRSSLLQLRQPDSTVAAELDMTTHFLELAKIRMGQRLHYTIDANPEVRQLWLPCMLLQPLVENALHHGIDPKVAGGTIAIQVHRVNGMLELRVDDDGAGLHASQRAGNGIALANLRERLRTRFGGAAALTLQARTIGTSAILTLPIQTKP
jgi:hypothetical protein